MGRFFTIIMFFLFSYSVACEETSVQIQNGILDLRNVDLANTVVRADGEWAFIYNEFVSPDAIESTNWVTQSTYQRKAGWNKQPIHNNYPALGYGTYFVRILTASNISDTELGFLLRLPKTSGNMFINGKLADSSGLPGTTPGTTVGSQKPLVGTGYGPKIDVVIHISNFSFNRGGIDESLYVGQYPLVKNKQSRTIALLMFSCGALSLVGIYHGILYLFRLKNKEVLILSIFSVAIAVRMLVLADKPYLLFWEGMDADIALKVEFWTVFFAMPLLYSYYYYIFPQTFSRLFSNIYIVNSLIICGISVTITSYEYAKLIPIFELYIVATYFAILFGLIKAIIKKQRYSFIFLCGFLVIFLGSINDILFERGIIKGGFIIQYAIFLFIICQAILIGKRFSDSQNKLEEIVKERTMQLQVAVLQSEKSHAEVQLLSNSIMNLLEEERKSISRELHDDFGQSIRAAGLYAEKIARDLKKQSNDQLDSIIASADKIVSELKIMYSKNRDLLRRLRPEIIDTLGLKAAIEELLNTYRNLDYEIDFVCNANVSTLNSAEQMTLYRILQESITNTVKYAQTHFIKVCLIEGANDITFSIADNGVGFNPEIAEGVGLISMRERIANIGGKISITSSIGNGTTIEAVVPKRSELPIHNDKQQ